MKHLRSLRAAAFASVGMAALAASSFAQDKPHETVTVEGAEGCKLELLNVVPMTIDNNQLTLQADVNGKTRTFQFDTAAIANQMTEAAAEAMGLHPSGRNYGGPRVTGNVGLAFAQTGGPGTGKPLQFHALSGNMNSTEQEIYDDTGASYSSLATVADFVMQTMEVRNVEFHISPLPPPNVDGLLNLELFEKRFDVDLNFADRRFNLFSRDHCGGKILYWRAPGVAALPYIARDHRILTHVMLDGTDFTAIIDTGSPVSVLRFDAAARLGVNPGDAGLTLVADHPGDVRGDLYDHAFKTLSFGTVAIGNPHIALTRGTVLVRGSDPHARTGSLVASDSREAQPEMIIGMDLLKLLHLYIAQGEGRLYVTQGTELPFNDAGALPTIPVTPFRP